MVVNHSPAVAFAAANVGFPKICVSPLFRNQNVYMLHACLATLIRICLILYQYRSRRSLRLLLSKIIANSGMILLLHFGAMGIAPQYIRCTPSAIGVPASSISSLSAGVGTQRSPPTDWERLTNTIQARRPRLLILDPLIRLHRVDENDASQIAALLSYLRQLQRTFQVAVLVVHHARKDASATRPGQALRGSPEYLMFSLGLWPTRFLRRSNWKKPTTLQPITTITRRFHSGIDSAGARPQFGANLTKQSTVFKNK